MIVYLLCWMFFILYYGIRSYKNYQEGQPFSHGQNPIVAFMTPLCLVLASLLVPSPVWRLVLAAVFILVILCLLILLERHNRAHYSGEAFLFRYREIKKWKGRLYMALGVLTIGLVLVGFLD